MDFWGNLFFQVAPGGTRPRMLRRSQRRHGSKFGHLEHLHCLPRGRPGLLQRTRRGDCRPLRRRSSFRISGRCRVPSVSHFDARLKFISAVLLAGRWIGNRLLMNNSVSEMRAINAHPTCIPVGSGGFTDTPDPYPSVICIAFPGQSGGPACDTRPAPVAVLSAVESSVGTSLQHDSPDAR